ncbi:MAG: flagellar biosynthesis protein FlhF [Phycisphaerae bacterium]
MNVKTFQGPSIAEALAKVKQELGSNAVILHTRSFKRGGVMGLGAKTVIEITAGVNVNVQARKKTAAAASAVNARKRNSDSGAFDSQSGGTAVAELPTDRPRHPLQVVYPKAKPAASPSSASGNSFNPATREMAASVLKEPAFELRNELSSLRTMVESLLQRTADMGGRRSDLPAQLGNLYMQLIQQQVSEEIAIRVVDDVKAELSPDQLSNPGTVRDRLTQKLEQMLPANFASAVARPATGVGCRSICLIGPTGVGKTTTIAKLAAAFKLRQRQKVGLITIDTYRIAAVDQLRTYANIIGVPLKVVLTPAELVAAMREMSDCDTILIDTAGRSHMDQMKLNELSQFIAAAKPSEVHLVLSSTTTQESMEAAIEQFSKIRVDQIIFTKLDEAVSFGVLLNVARAASRALSYLTTGQDVPDNIEVGQPRRLAKLILGEKL